MPTTANDEDERARGIALTASLYTRVYPSMEELRFELGEEVPEDALQDIVAELRQEVDMLKDETEMFEHQVDLLQLRPQSRAVAEVGTNTGPGFSSAPRRSTEPSSSASGLSFEESLGTSSYTPEGVGETGRGGGPRRGKNYQRKSRETGGVYVTLQDKVAMIARECESLLAQERSDHLVAEEVREVLRATVEEAAQRSQELQLEVRQFMREVGCSIGEEGVGPMSRSPPPGGFSTYADEVLKYMARRRISQDSYLDKLQRQCRVAAQEIARTLQQLRQHQAAGEAFRPVDFEQLRIENEQFNERVEKKNTELMELKSASTRAVQQLNATTDALNELATEQSHLKKECKSRCEYLARCSKEVKAVEKESTVVEKKNETIRAKHSAVRVPRIEEYIAQRAELFELEKAEKNWTRKVEITQGQSEALRLRIRRLRAQREAAIAYATTRRNQRVTNLKADLQHRLATSVPAPRKIAPQQQHAMTTTAAAYPHAEAAMGSIPVSHEPPLVKSSKALLELRRGKTPPLRRPPAK